ncbi:MAG: hypothetical protein IPJ22_10070 [Bacteroidetes bacterium]|nr:hypothetical protein [Bacteroidota bacterium]
MGEKESFEIEIPKESIIPPEKKLPILILIDDYDLLKADDLDDILIEEIETEVEIKEELDIPYF